MNKLALVLALFCCATVNPAMAQLKPDTTDNPLGFGSSHIDITLPPSQSFLRTPTFYGGGVVNFQSSSHPWEVRPFGLENNTINNSVASPESYVTEPMNFRSLGINMTTQPMQAEALHPTGMGAYGMTRTIGGSSAGIAGMNGAAMMDRLNESMGGGSFGAGLGGGFGAGANRAGTGGIGGSLFGPGSGGSSFGGFGSGSGLGF